MNNEIKIAVDAMGGDGSPKKIIDGIIHHYKNNTDTFYQIFGDNEQIEDLIKDKLPTSCYEIVHTNDVVKGTDSPLEAAKSSTKIKIPQHTPKAVIMVRNPFEVMDSIISFQKSF